MKNKKVNRRNFLLKGMQSVAGLSVLAGCNSRSAFIGSDNRLPSAPRGLTKKIVKQGEAINVSLSWQPHDYTDITGSKKPEGTIISYTLFRDDEEIVSNLIATSYVDSTGLSQNKTYEYGLIAVDENGNKSPFSQVLTVVISPFVNVYVAVNKSVTSGTPTSPNIAASVVKNMVHAAVKRLTNQTTIGAAYESLFPVLSANTTIGLKINTLGGKNVSTKPATVLAIVDGLTQMLGNSFPAYNIIVFDDRPSAAHMKDAGFVFRNELGKYRVTSLAENTTIEPISDLWGSTINVAKIPIVVSTLVEKLDYIINMPVLKDHSNAGLTFSMKNLYGIISAPAKLHGTMCDPFIPALYSATVSDVKLTDKIRLIVGDALVACANGGPSGMPTHLTNTIIVGIDPVAMDAWALDKLNTLRKSDRQITFNADSARHIYTASQPPYSLGSLNYNPVEVIS